MLFFFSNLEQCLFAYHLSGIVQLFCSLFSVIQFKNFNVFFSP